MFRTKKELRHEFPECQRKSCPSFTTGSTQSTFCVIAILVSNEQERESSKNLVTLSSSTQPSLSAQPSLVSETRLFDGRHRLMPAYHLKILQFDIRDIFYFLVSLTFFFLPCLCCISEDILEMSSDGLYLFAATS